MKSRLIVNTVSGTLELKSDRRLKIRTDGEVLETGCCHDRISPRVACFLAGDAVSYV